MLDSARCLLDAAYSDLGFDRGALHSAATAPDPSTTTEWLDRGDWLALAQKVGAEKVFFVNEHPVVVFAEQPPGDPAGWIRQFNSVWCMARPQMLFLASEGELAVLNLTSPPGKLGDAKGDNDRLLAVVGAVKDVQVQLAQYRREQVESGRLFEEERFGSHDRADRALIRDLGKVRSALLNDRLSPANTHALIGRSIFVRYLEDRGVLTREYFEKVIRSARSDQRTEWERAFAKDDAAAGVVGPEGPIFYPRVLRSKSFTYALFRRLSEDFNGDMFPVNDEEQLEVTEAHLGRLRQFLLGDVDSGLFFYAYRFDVIPIELISSMYERFYSVKPGKQRDDGAYYTPPSLVDFVLSQTLTTDTLATNPRVLDPACGSGIFLVESFRRIVRFRSSFPGTKLSADELRGILRDQIRGIDINREAIRVAAFSLYLALLHYMEPPDILRHRLPSLTYTNRSRRNSSRHFDILLVSDAFNVEANVDSPEARKRFGSGCADAVVGNPPWGKPTPEDQLASDGGVRWCEERSLPVGDKERSQTFIHRSLDLLRPGGRAGLLVSTGVLFKSLEPTKRFRECWLRQVTLRSVVNFAAVRDTFFRSDTEPGQGPGGAVAPFASVVFDASRPANDSRFTYWSAKESGFVARVQVVVLSAVDRAVGVQARFACDDSLWKIYWWGNHRDEALVQRMRAEPTLASVLDPDDEGFRSGFVEGKKERSVTDPWFRRLRVFPIKEFQRYGILPCDRFEDAPSRVRRTAQESVYVGPRLLIKRGVGRAGIVARFEEDSFLMSHSVYSVKVEPGDMVRAKVVLGILWSSLAKYFLFMTSGSWGLWHDEILKGTYQTIPAPVRADSAAARRVVDIVDRLRTLPVRSEAGPLFANPAAHDAMSADVARLESELDAAVLDLFGLAPDERERITDLCDMGLDLFYKGMRSNAVRPIAWDQHEPPGGRVAACLLGDGSRDSELGPYANRFLAVWGPRLKPQGGSLRWRALRSPGDSGILAFVVETEAAGRPLPDPTPDEGAQWRQLLGVIARQSRVPVAAERVYVDGLVRVVGDHEIVILKRNERRLWTAAKASDDAEATMLMAMARSLTPTVRDEAQ